jgi:uncharacterized protein YegL
MSGKKINYVSLVLDESGSMQSILFKVRELLAQTIADIKNRAKEDNQETYFTICKFGSHKKLDVVFDSINAYNENLVISNYDPHGQTALVSAITATLNAHARQSHNLMDDVAHLMIAITDGKENNSPDDEVGKFPELIKQFQSKENVTMVFNMPPGSSGWITKYGVPAGNVREWEATEIGTHETQIATESAYREYTKSRSLGTKKVSNFYSVVTDLSEVKTNDLQKCDNLTTHFKLLKVPAEQRIDEFVRTQTGQPYIRGTAFYQLTKPEEIQGHKDVLIKEKTSSMLWGGPQARKLLGLQPYKTGKVVPGNHSNFDIFVQSTADNRKLVRGTQLALTR